MAVPPIYLMHVQVRILYLTLLNLATHARWDEWGLILFLVLSSLHFGGVGLRYSSHDRERLRKSSVLNQKFLSRIWALGSSYARFTPPPFFSSKKKKKKKNLHFNHECLFEPFIKIFIFIIFLKQKNGCMGDNQRNT